MAVVHLVPHISKEASGPSYSVVRLCESLRDQGLDVVLITLEWESTTYPPFVKAFPVGFGPLRLGRSPAMMHWLNSQVRSGQAEILHSHCLWQMNTVYPGWVAKTGKTKLVVSPRGMLSSWTLTHGSTIFKKAFWILLQKPTISQAFCFHATSKNEYNDIRRLGFQQPVAIIPNGIDIPPLESTGGLSNEVRTLLFLSRIHPKKGIDLLLHAWRAIHKRFSDWRLVIAGGDVGYYGTTGYLRKMRLLAERLGLRRVEFVGELHGAEKWRAYQEADLYILPSYSENFGITVAEALAAGTPVIATTGTPWPELPQKGAGWWIEPNLDSLVACLEHALALPKDELVRMGLRGRSWMEKDFSWSRVAQMMRETYEWLTGRRKTTPEWVYCD